MAETKNEQLNWAGGPPQTTPSAVPPVGAVFNNVVPVPDCSQGQCSGVDAIVNYTGRAGK